MQALTVADYQIQRERRSFFTAIVPFWGSAKRICFVGRVEAGEVTDTRKLSS